MASIGDRGQRQSLLRTQLGRESDTAETIIGGGPAGRRSRQIQPSAARQLRIRIRGCGCGRQRSGFASTEDAQLSSTPLLQRTARSQSWSEGVECPARLMASRSFRHRNRHSLAGAAFSDPNRVAIGLDCGWCLDSFLNYRDTGLIAVDCNNGNLAATVLGKE